MKTKKLIKILCDICIHQKCNKDCPLFDEISNECLKEQVRYVIEVADNYRKDKLK